MNSRSDIGLLQPTYHLCCWPFSAVELQKYWKRSHSLECYCQGQLSERLCQLLLCSCLPDGELSLYYKVLLPTIAIFQPQKNCNTTCNTKHATSIAIPVAILKSIAILIAIIAILQYYQPWPWRRFALSEHLLVAFVLVANVPSCPPHVRLRP